MKRTENPPYQLWFFEACMLLLVIVGIYSCYSGYILNEQQKDLQTNGHLVLGTVRGAYSIRTSRFNVEYGVKYLFTVGSHTYYGDSPVSHDFYRTIHAGTPTEVLYLQDNPTINLDSASKDSNKGVNEMLSGFLSAAVGACIGIFIMFSARKSKKSAPPLRKH